MEATLPFGYLQLAMADRRFSEGVVHASPPTGMNLDSRGSLDATSTANPTPTVNHEEIHLSIAGDPFVESNLALRKLSEAFGIFFPLLDCVMLLTANYIYIYIATFNERATRSEEG